MLLTLAEVVYGSEGDHYVFLGKPRGFFKKLCLGCFWYDKCLVKIKKMDLTKGLRWKKNILVQTKLLI